MRTHPHLYEVNARLWLRVLSEKHGRALTLSTVPEEEWKALVEKGFDLVWLMGVWRRSPGARETALTTPELKRAYDQSLPGWSEQDVEGSPYAVYEYSLDGALGRPEELAELKARLKRLGLGLILDFVSNHLALDHPWTESHPERFVRAGKEEALRHPGWFFRTKSGAQLAYGRDPNFPPWTDTAQVNFFSKELREAFEALLLEIAKLCDGVRCDMAMLAMNRVFADVWGPFLQGERPAEEFWPGLIKNTRRRRPGFIFLAEAYWNLEWDLQQLGFDFTYDKILYDRLRRSSAGDIRGHLMAADIYQKRCARFIENHDEARAVTAFGKERSSAAAVVMATVPGLRFFHDGQLEGRSLRIPVQLVRQPSEPGDPELRRFYERLLSFCDEPALHGGEWRLLEVLPAWDKNETHQNVLAWLWRQSGRLKVVVVNFSPAAAQARVRLPYVSASKAKIAFQDRLTEAVFERDSPEVVHHGLFVDLGPWKAHLLDVG